MPSKKSNSATAFCRICFKKFIRSTVKTLLYKNNHVCPSCYAEMGAKFTRFSHFHTEFTAIFPYNQKIQTMIYQFKGCGDIEMGECFLEYVLPLLKIRYRNYVLIGAPSAASHNQKRGYNHVEFIFSKIGIPFIEALEKIGERKQTDCTVNERKKVGQFIRWKSGVSIKGKNVLFVDDVFTTGSTAKACLALIYKHHPAKVRGLVLAKTEKT